MRRWILIGCGVVGLSVSVTAQSVTILGPTPSVSFVSPQHYANYLDGTPIITTYQLEVTAMNSLGAVAFTIDLGKPAPDGTGTVIVAVPQLTTITPNTTYTARVYAVGPGGSGVSDPSNPFGVTALVRPASLANVRIK